MKFFCCLIGSIFIFTPVSFSSESLSVRENLIYVGRGEAFDWNGWTSDCRLSLRFDETNTHVNIESLDFQCGALSKQGRAARLNKVGNTLVNDQGIAVGTWGDSWMMFDLATPSLKLKERIKIQRHIGYIEYHEDWLSEAGDEWYLTLKGEMSPRF